MEIGIVGLPNVGKSTIFKQYKLIHGYGFEDSEHFEALHVIRSNAVCALLSLLKFIFYIYIYIYVYYEYCI